MINSFIDDLTKVELRTKRDSFSIKETFAHIFDKKFASCLSSSQNHAYCTDGGCYPNITGPE
jgi:hypothetical protein